MAVLNLQSDNFANRIFISYIELFYFFYFNFLFNTTSYSFRALLSSTPFFPLVALTLKIFPPSNEPRIKRRDASKDQLYLT